MTGIYDCFEYDILTRVIYLPDEDNGGKLFNALLL